MAMVKIEMYEQCHSGCRLQRINPLAMGETLHWFEPAEDCIHLVRMTYFFRIS